MTRENNIDQTTLLSARGAHWREIENAAGVSGGLTLRLARQQQPVLLVMRLPGKSVHIDPLGNVPKQTADALRRIAAQYNKLADSVAETANDDSPIEPKSHAVVNTSTGSVISQRLFLHDAENAIAQLTGEPGTTFIVEPMPIDSAPAVLAEYQRLTAV